MAALTSAGHHLEWVELFYPCLTAFMMTEHWLKQPNMLPSHIAVKCQTIWRCTNHHKTPKNMPSLTGVGMNLDQVKYTYPCLTAFMMMTEHWLKQTKNLPSHIAVQCQMKMHQWPQNPYNKTSLTGVGMSLCQAKHTYPCLPAFIMTEHWVKQPKMRPYHIAVQCQTMKMHW